MILARHSALSLTEQAAKAQGKLSVAQVLDLKESGVDVAGLLSEDVRNNLFQQEVGQGA